MEKNMEHEMETGTIYIDIYIYISGLSIPF